MPNGTCQAEDGLFGWGYVCNVPRPWMALFQNEWATCGFSEMEKKCLRKLPNSKCAASGKNIRWPIRREWEPIWKHAGESDCVWTSGFNFFDWNVGLKDRRTYSRLAKGNLKPMEGYGSNELGLNISLTPQIMNIEVFRRLDDEPIIQTSIRRDARILRN